MLATKWWLLHVVLLQIHLKSSSWLHTDPLLTVSLVIKGSIASDNALPCTGYPEEFQLQPLGPHALFLSENKGEFQYLGISEIVRQNSGQPEQ